MAAALCALQIPAAEIVTLRPVADTSLFEFTPDDNMGGAALAAGRIDRDEGRARALIKFDPAASIPAGARIESVRFTIRVTKVPPSPVNSTFSLHKVLRPWGEGNKAVALLGGPATAGEATWNARAVPSESWGAPGGLAGVDYVAAATASRTIAGVAAYPYESSPGLVADVQSWLDNPAGNFGWILISAAEDRRKSAKRFGSRETTSTAPSMIIEYTPAAAGISPQISTPPVPQTVPLGGTAIFQVVATGTEPLSYQWLKGDAPVGDGTNATLTLNNVTLEEAGEYSVLVTNSAGFAMSARARLIVIVPDLAPAFTAVSLVNGNVLLRFQARAGNTYVFESTPALPSSTWLTLSNITAATEDRNAEVADLIGAGNRFYRLRATVGP